MGIKLKKPDLNRYNNADHVEYHETTYRLCEKFADIIGEQLFLEAYRAKIGQEANIYNWVRKSEFTGKKADTDRRRDSAYTGMMGIVRANLNSVNPQTRGRAQHVFNLIHNYGDLTHSGYDAETADVDSILARLYSSDYQEAVSELGLAPWMEELAAANSLFKTLVENRMMEQLEKPETAPKEARKQTDSALRTITDRITAKINIDGAGRYEEFIKGFNVTTDHYNTLLHEHYGRLHARTGLSAAKVGDIGTQPYTGKPVFVIPSVTLEIKENDDTVKPVDLVFTVDFTVGYRNNVNPGTASLIITGIGKYAGEIITTFNIVNSE
jgi:hypothetical protein